MQRSIKYVFLFAVIVCVVDFSVAAQSDAGLPTCVLQLQGTRGAASASIQCSGGSSIPLVAALDISYFDKSRISLSPSVTRDEESCGNQSSCLVTLCSFRAVLTASRLTGLDTPKSILCISGGSEITFAAADVSNNQGGIIVLASNSSALTFKGASTFRRNGAEEAVVKATDGSKVCIHKKHGLRMESFATPCTPAQH